jgi:hypothetical protein
MALFSRQADPGSSQPASRQGISSPAFAKLWSRFGEERKYHILDLGKASSTNLNFYSSLRCKLFIGELLPGIHAWQAGAADEEHPSLSLPELLGIDRLGDLDLVMCWDNLNYLDEKTLVQFSSALHRHMRPGGFLHAFITTHAHMPAAPAAFHIVAPSRMEADYPQGDDVSAPNYSQRRLAALMQGFAVRESRLLQSGMQEYVFCSQ